MRLRAALAALTLLAVTAACDVDLGEDETTLRVLAGSELADLRPILEQAEDEIGVEVELDFAGTLDGVQRVLDGKADGRYEAVWFSSDRYLTLHTGARAKLGTSVRTMRSPVVLGLRASVASQLGWDATPPTWAEIADAAGKGRFGYGMTSPAASNSGFSTLVAVTAALSGSGTALDAAAIRAQAPGLKRFFSAQRLTSGSSGWLSERLVDRNSAGAEVDGMFNYESELLALNASGRLPEQFTIIRPRDGVITADYPLTLLASAPAAARDAHARLTGYLRRPEVQRQIMSRTHRRPAVPEVRPEARFGESPPELPFPSRLDAVDTLVAAYYDEFRRPARTIYVLDVSGSMAGDRIAGLRSALTALTGADGSLAGRFQRFHNREEVTLMLFNSRPGRPVSYVIPERDPAAELARIRNYAGALRNPRGGTAIYDSLAAAYRVAGEQAARDPDRYTSIVLMSDGENTAGTRLAQFRLFHAGLPEGPRAVPVFAVLFGEARADEMAELARLTGGRTFDARSQSLATVFREIRGYQ
ncbi:hypothetical protein DPM19_32965 [Actinomadura craniellae]|uniref:VWFA domain-containing protein n=1 Tax=Actinomadura craniellae TaxID=2231787 RepID=A0A365GVX8_9ACTN|nr:VWA domain-containing protein [Actinomadura craniellae]RAY10945.1 hypothetical protein DPM19_32965 [Actinomadura craniellae]